MLESLDTLIGFVTVVLTLSLISTALVQATASIGRIRGRNLYRGVREILGGVSAMGGGMDNREKLTRELFDEDLLDVRSKLLPGKWRTGGLGLKLLGPARTWIDLEEIEDFLVKKNAPRMARRTIRNLFPRMEKLTRKRFAFQMRIWTMIWAVVVAIVFQVSAPKLIRDLSTDAAFRKAAAAAAKGALELAEESESAPTNGLAKLREKYPAVSQLKDLELSGETRAEHLDELSAALVTGDPATPIAERDVIVDAYFEILVDADLERAREARGDLVGLEIEPWPQGKEFYFSNPEEVSKWNWPWKGDLVWENVVGVLGMALLLSLGAPFWYNALKNLAGLRDQLSPPDASKTRGAKNTD
jgi:PAS domain-containing protein